MTRPGGCCLRPGGCCLRGAAGLGWCLRTIFPSCPLGLSSMPNSYLSWCLDTPFTSSPHFPRNLSIPGHPPHPKLLSRAGCLFSQARFLRPGAVVSVFLGAHCCSAPRALRPGAALHPSSLLVPVLHMGGGLGHSPVCPITALTSSARYFFPGLHLLLEGLVNPRSRSVRAPCVLQARPIPTMLAPPLPSAVSQGTTEPQGASLPPATALNLCASFAFCTMQLVSFLSQMHRRLNAAGENHKTTQICANKNSQFPMSKQSFNIPLASSVSSFPQRRSNNILLP